MLDWSTTLIAPRAHDAGFTSLLLSEAPLDVPGWARPAVRTTGRLLAGRFVRRYQRAAGVRTTRRPWRSSSATPTWRSSAARCWETAGAE